jgi:hypothetical protein
VTRRTLTLKGSIAGGPVASVVVRPAGSVLPVLDRRFQSDSGSTSYTVRGLIPGRYTVTIQPSGDALSPRPKALTLAASPTTVVQNSAVGPKPGTYTVRFVSGAAPVQDVFVTAADGHGDVTEIVTGGTGGRATVRGLQAGTYRYVRSSFAASGDGNAPAADGPWWFGAVSRTFSVTAGRTTDDGTIALHVRATL